MRWDYSPLGINPVFPSLGEIIIIIIIIIIVLGYIRNWSVMSEIVAYVRNLVGYIRNDWLYQCGRWYRTLYKNIVNLDLKYLILITYRKPVKLPLCENNTYANFYLLNFDLLQWKTLSNQKAAM